MSSVNQRVAALHPPERIALDRIRRELGMERQRNPCPFCGDERWEEGTRWVRGHPIEHCETCGGKRVRAANLLRAIRELASPTRGGFTYERVEDNPTLRRPGQVESGVVLVSGRAFNGNED